MIEEQKQRALIAIDLARDDLIQLSHKIHDHGEIAYEEHQSAALLEQYLKSKGFDIESGIGGLPTAFIGMMQGKSSERIIALLAEYDALPKIGHGCGHNLIAAGAIGAAIGIAEVISELPGVVKVIGTPAEEYAGGKSGKIILLEKGVFSDIGISLMFHPWTRSGVPKSDLGFMILEATFHGKSAHASGDPWSGRNALDAVVLSYTNVGLLRQQVRPDSRIHAIIIHGGDLINVVPEIATIRFMFRSPDKQYLQILYKQIVQCIEASGLATGTQAEIKIIAQIDSSLFNLSLYDVVKANSAILGESLELLDFWGVSSDYGNVSRMVPSLYFLIQTHKLGIPWHSREVTELGISDQANEGMIRAAKILALSAIDLLMKPSIFERVNQDFINKNISLNKTNL